MYFLKWLSPAHFFFSTNTFLAFIFCSLFHAHSKNPAAGARGGSAVPQPADSDQTLSHKALLQVAAQWLVSMHSGGTTVYLFIYSDGQTKHHIDKRLQLIIRNVVIYPPAFRHLSINMPSENISQMSRVFVHPCRALSAVRGFTDGTWHAWSTGGAGPSQPLSRCRRSCVVTDFWGRSSRRWRSPALSPVQVKLQPDTTN